ncbi:MAG: exodeoxyribonuclease VII large subunit [Pirellulales bacterium]
MALRRTALKSKFVLERSRLETWAGKLESLSPLGVLVRGYSVTQCAADDAVVTSAAEVRPGDVLRTRLAQGEVLSTVRESTAETDSPGEQPA